MEKFTFPKGIGKFLQNNIILVNIGKENIFQMELKMNRKGGRLYVKISGEIDHHNAPAIRENVDLEVKSGGVRKLIFDFSGLTFMDSSGIGILMGRYKLMQLYGGSVTVVGACDYIEKIIRLSGLENIIILQKAV